MRSGQRVRDRDTGTEGTLVVQFGRLAAVQWDERGRRQPAGAAAAEVFASCLEPVGGLIGPEEQAAWLRGQIDMLPEDAPVREWLEEMLAAVLEELEELEQ